MSSLGNLKISIIISSPPSAISVRHFDLIQARCNKSIKADCPTMLWPVTWNLHSGNSSQGRGSRVQYSCIYSLPCKVSDPCNA
jgi:hypothetical protein